VGAVVDFVIIAFVVFTITKALLKPTPAPPAPRRQMRGVLGDGARGGEEVPRVRERGVAPAC
jgi:hypothetical protein